MSRLLFILTCLCSLSAAELRPSPEVPPPASAYITKLVSAPDDDRLIIAATNGSGLYRSSTAGDTWQQISPADDLRYIHVAVFDPHDSSRLYVGGRESGLWVVTNNGSDWEHVALGKTSVLSLVIDPQDARRLLVLTPDGVHRSLNGAGGPWRQVFDYPDFIAQRPAVWPDPDWPVRFSRFQHLTIDPRNPATLLLGGRWEGGYHRSDDGGDTWQHLPLGPIFRRADRVLFDPIDANILYAETHHQGLFKSFNRGRSWVSSSHGIAPQKRTPHYGAVLISGMAFAPENPTTLYAGSDYSNWRSTDAGASWQEVGETLTCEFARSFLITSDTVYAGTNVGIYRSHDDGLTWTTSNRGLPERKILATTQGTVRGERFEFALCEGRPAVYRRSLDRHTDWVSISWLLYESATAIRFEPETETLVIQTESGERRSQTGGLRWDVSPTVYLPKPVIHPAAPAPPAPSADRTENTFAIAIHGAARPDDSPVESMYQRPPYIALAVVGPGYPEDGSEPLWRGHWTDHLSGSITVPASVLKSTITPQLRVEVRDFQYGTRTGSAPLNQTEPTIIDVRL